MTLDPVPVILVHGWNSHPGVWNRLIPRLDAAGIPYSRFSHEKMAHESIPRIAEALFDHVRQYRDESGYRGPVDTVSHSMGTCITRYCLEVMDGKERRAHVRQLIGLGPPNNGSALAKLFNDPDHGKEITNNLAGVFVPAGFDPVRDLIVKDVMPGSRVMAELGMAGLRGDIAYRVIVTGNPQGTPAFFPVFDGMTWEIGPDGRYRQTIAGDGIVAHSESALPGIPLDIILQEPDAGGRYPDPDTFCHTWLPKNPAVIDRIMWYLTGGR